MRAAPATIAIGSLAAADWDGVARIYAEGIATGDATFETEAPDRRDWDAAHLPTPRLAARAEGRIVGWAALSPVSGRCVYAGVAEVSVYVAAAARGGGVGAALLAALVAGSEAEGVWTLQAGIFPENASSLRLHERAGFLVVGRRERLGALHGVWRDVVLLERRSAVVA